MLATIYLKYVSYDMYSNYFIIYLSILKTGSDYYIIVTGFFNQVSEIISILSSSTILKNNYIKVKKQVKFSSCLNFIKYKCFI